jgi:hypothetical protein
LRVATPGQTLALCAVALCARGFYHMGTFLALKVGDLRPPAYFSTLAHSLTYTWLPHRQDVGAQPVALVSAMPLQRQFRRRIYMQALKWKWTMRVSDVVVGNHWSVEW